MRIWLDAQLPPGLCSWLEEEFDVQAEAVRDLGLRDAKDPEIFAAARERGAVVMSKDADFAKPCFAARPASAGPVGYVRQYDQRGAARVPLTNSAGGDGVDRSGGAVGPSRRGIRTGKRTRAVVTAVTLAVTNPATAVWRHLAPGSARA